MALRYDRVNREIRPGRYLIGVIREAGKEPVRRAAGNLWQDHACKAISIKPEEATPERVARENAEAKRHGTGAVYDKDGVCHLSGRGSRAREMRRLGRMDNDAGFGDYAGR